MAKFDLASEVAPGPGRLWSVVHQPSSQKTPVRLELREAAISEETRPAPLSMTKLLGYANTVADAKALKTTAEEILARVGRVDEFVGVYR